jgi:hypothetical protein
MILHRSRDVLTSSSRKMAVFQILKKCFISITELPLLKQVVTRARQIFGLLIHQRLVYILWVGM